MLRRNGGQAWGSLCCVPDRPLPCIAFLVTEVRRRPGSAEDTLFTYGVKADGVEDLLITTEEKLIQFWPARSVRRTFLLVRLWDCRLLGLPGFANDEESLGHWSQPQSPRGSPVDEQLADSESHSRALRLIVHRTVVQCIFASAAAWQRVQEDCVRLRYHCTSQRCDTCLQYDGLQDPRNIVAVSIYFSFD
ncbi:hypothetical protein EDB19DRAFT_910376 [Suillus lakei]|nr:hypothetical protein EDB19DRAFT_910376 [Suillus lakei]